jgi:hypothetical protein
MELIALPTGFDHGQFMFELLSVAFPFLTVAFLFAGFRLIKRAIGKI